MWQTFLINLGIKLITNYINSSETKEDDKVLDLVKTGAKYIVESDNNNLDYKDIIYDENEIGA